MPSIDTLKVGINNNNKKHNDQCEVSLMDYKVLGLCLDVCCDVQYHPPGRSFNLESTSSLSLFTWALLRIDLRWPGCLKLPL